MDRVIFGDNQFFGINHMSEDKAQAQAERFQSLSAIIDVIDSAYDCGIRGFRFNTHDRVAEIWRHMAEGRDWHKADGGEGAPDDPVGSTRPSTRSCCSWPTTATSSHRTEQGVGRAECAARPPFANSAFAPR